MKAETDLLFSIGYGNRSLNQFLNLIKQYEIELLIDVRSYPDRAYIAYYKRKHLKEHLDKNSVAYEFLGDKLGGMPNDKSCYLDGKVSYPLIMKKKFFIDGINELLKMSRNKRVVYLCSELDEFRCHRMHLIAKFIEDKFEIKTNHINRYGALSNTLSTLFK